MASGSKSVEENAVAKWEVGPTEDVVQAFMETLVDPPLPLRVSAIDPPSQDVQNSIARQMHAVVLLYNYYHRQQKPELEFLDFVSFCKLAVSLRPPLLAFMKLMNESQSMELNGAEDQLSVTEKAIKNACDIALALDASTNVPNTEGWPVSKIAVLLLDKSNENFRLQFGDITEGVWSTYEKDINKSYSCPEVSVENKVGTGVKRKRNAEFLQLAYDVAKEVTGIDSSDLVVMGTHITYSLSKEKTANRVYLIQCPQTFSRSEEVPIKFLLESLQGPLAKKAFGSWTSTSVVEYHHMLPYLGFISRWLSGKELYFPILSGSNAEKTNNSCQKQLTQSRISPSPVSNCNGKELNHISRNHSESKTESCDKRADHNSDNNHKKCRQSSGGEAETAVSIAQCQANSGDVIGKLKQKNDILSSAVKGSSIICWKHLDKETSEFKSFHQTTVKDCSAMEKLKKSDTVGSAKKEESNKLETLSDPSRGIKTMNMNETSNLNAGAVVSLKSSECIDENASGENGDFTVSYDRNGVSDQNGDKRLPPVDGAENNVEAQSVQASDVLRNALALLYMKREELSSQICSMEDELAVYEDSIERIRDGGNVGLAHLCIKSIITGNKNLMLKHESQIQDKVDQAEKDHSRSLSGSIIFPGTSSCEDLEYTCRKNNWRLPRYSTEPLNGKFLSKVIVASKDLELSSKGDLKSNPGEARESAAAKMIAKIHDLTGLIEAKELCVSRDKK